MRRHLLIVADGRSPTTLSWINNILTLDLEISLISTFPCQQPPGITHFHILPVAFSKFSTRDIQKTRLRHQQKSVSGIKRMVRKFAPVFQILRYSLGPLTLQKYAQSLRQIVQDIQPDLIHALRIPFEGMLASSNPDNIPFLVSTWGNDLTLHAKGSILMRRHTRRCLQRADGLISDTHRDIRLAKDWGFDADAPTLVVPGSGGVDLDAIQRSAGFNESQYNIPLQGDWVVNPRGIRPGSVHQEAFIAAIPMVLAKHPDTLFLCPGLAGKEQIIKKVEKSGISEKTFLLPRLSQRDVWGLMKRSSLFISPSSHDGTPNTLLEAMACGCFPIAGDIESLREWIDPGVNGYLVDPRNPESLAEAIIKALEFPELRVKAARHNMKLIQTQADRRTTIPKIQNFYNRFIA